MAQCYSKNSLKVGEQQVNEILEEEQQRAAAMPINLDHLLGRGAQKRDIDLLKVNGFNTVECVAYAPMKSLLQIRGISEQKAEFLKKASKELVGIGFTSATEYLRARQNLLRFTTGSVQLDRLLQGGVETGNLTELFGEFRTG